MPNARARKEILPPERSECLPCSLNYSEHPAQGLAPEALTKLLFLDERVCEGG